MPHLLLVSHNPLLTTGYARVTSTLARAFVAAGHRVTVLGLGYQGEAHREPYRVLPWESTESAGELEAAVDGDRPGLVLTIGDPWMFEWLPALPARRRVKWLAYFPVDGRPLPAAWAEWCRAPDDAVVFCDFSRGVVSEATGRSPYVIPHGVDTGTFRPLDKGWAKARVGVDGRFVVGTVAANQQRKNLPALIRAFAEFAEGKDDAILYLHTQIAPGGYWEVDELVRRFGVEPKTRATLNLDPRRGVPDETLATVYNSFDVFALPTMAEGFGLPILESQACGVPALVTDFSACPELVPEAFCRLRVAHTLIMARNFDQAVVDERDLADKLDRLYRDRRELARLACAAHAFARAFAWAEICERFVGRVRKLVG
jgi:glycosyltransferase involved in cell wall biosynthesis